MADLHRNGLPGLARLPMLTPLPWAVVVGYVIVFLILDWASFIRPLQGLNITPWNPQPVLAVALLVASRRLWWVVIAGLLAAEVLVRGLPGDLVVVAMAEVELKRTLAFVQGIIDAFPDFLFEGSAEGRYLNTWTKNPELLAASREHMLGRTLDEVLSPASAAIAKAAFREADEMGL